MITVVPVRTSGNRRRFIDFPYVHYRADPHWIPPLRIGERQRFDQRHPFYEHATVELFLAQDGERIVGRIAAIDDRLHNETHRDNLAAFGYFETASREAAEALLAAAEAWARARGRRRIRGPLNPSLNDMCGLLVDGFDEDPMVMMPYNPPEYSVFLEGAGYRKTKDLLAFIMDLHLAMKTETMTRLVGRSRRHGLVVQAIQPSRIERELHGFLELYARAWQDNWGFVAPTAAEAHHMVSELKYIIDPDLVLRADVNGRAAGFIVAVPDLNQVLKGTGGRVIPKGLARFLVRRRIITQVRTLLFGVLPEFRRLMMGPVLVAELLRRSQVRYRRAELSWVLEDNDEVAHYAAAVGAKRYKTYRLFEKALV